MVRSVFTQTARLAAVLPYLWLLVFFLLPFAFVLKISLSQTAIAQPPYLPTFDLAAGWTAFLDSVKSLSAENYRLLGADSIYVWSYLRSVVVAAISAVILLAIGYPIAYGMARLPPRWQPIAMMLVIVPFWTSFLIRVYAWINILQHDGLLNQILLALHIVRTPPVWLSTDTAMMIGIVYSYLPFMVLPIYAVLEKFDWTVLEAAADLGAKPLRAFFRVTLPLSLPGIFSGVLLVFIPALGEFIVPELLGGPDTLMVGRVLWTEFFSNRDWLLAAALAIGLLVLILIPALAMFRLTHREERA